MKDNIKEGYKDSVLGEIPVDWEVVKLGEVCEQIKDGTHGTHKDVIDGIPLLSAKDIRGGIIFVPQDCRKISREDFNLIHKNFILKNGDILITVVGTIGRVAILKEYENNYTFQRSVGYIRLNNNCFSDFYVQYFQTEQFVKQLMLSSNASAQAGVYLGALAKICIGIPPLEEQKKIAEILCTVDEKIDVVEQNIKETKELKKGLMQKLLTKGINHSKFKDSPLGQIPDSWEVVKLGEVGEIISGGTPKTNNTDYWGGDVKWITPTDVTSLKGYRYITKTSRTITNEGLEKSSARLISPNSLIICTRATIGECVINKEELATNQGFKTIVPCYEYLTEYLYYLVTYLKPSLIQLSSGSTFLELSTSIFKKIEIVSPPLQEQKQIAEILTGVDDKIDILEKKKLEHQDLKKGLMQQLLTGKTRVKLN